MPVGNNSETDKLFAARTISEFSRKAAGLNNETLIVEAAVWYSEQELPNGLDDLERIIELARKNEESGMSLSAQSVLVKKALKDAIGYTPE